MINFGVQLNTINILYTLANPAEVIGHYYCFLLENLDSSVICQLMLEMKLLTEDDLVHCAKMCSEHQKNTFLMDHLLAAGTTRIVGFCHLLQDTENHQEIGTILTNGNKSFVS